MLVSERARLVAARPVVECEPFACDALHIIFIVVFEWGSLSLFGCAAHMETC